MITATLRTLFQRTAVVVVLTIALSFARSQNANNQLPSMGDTGELSVAAERKMGERIAREMYRDPDYLDDPLLVDYVQGIWQPLLAAARQRGELGTDMAQQFAWQVLLGKDHTVNAFAVPGGYLGLHLGMMSVVANRDELASVLAHELSHVTQRHISRMMSEDRKNMPLMIAGMILGALAASRNPQAGAAIFTGSQAAGIQGQLNFSRDMEREADRVGYGVMTQAGFDPHGFVTMFEKLEQATRVSDGGSYPYLRTHPMTTERIADMQARNQMSTQIRADATKPMSLEHAILTSRARYLSRNEMEVMRQWAQEPASRSFHTLSTAQQAAALYSAALAAAKLGDLSLSERWQGRLQTLVRSDAKANRLAQLLAPEIALMTNAATVNWAALANQLAPSVSTADRQRPELLLYSQIVVRQHQGDLVTQKLQTWVADHPRDAGAWQMLSGAWADAKQPLRAIRAEAEMQIAALDYAAARDRLKAAQELSRRLAASGQPIDHIEASIIDARTHEVEAMLRQQVMDEKEKG